MRHQDAIQSQLQCGPGISTGENFLVRALDIQEQELQKGPGISAGEDTVGGVEVARFGALQ